MIQLASNWQFTGTPWPHQEYGVNQSILDMVNGGNRICLSSPTGTGKTYMMQQLTMWARSNDWKVALYTNRRNLLKQLSADFNYEGISHGFRASGFPASNKEPVQLCMVQTEVARVLKAGYRDLHDAELVIIDEAHVNCNGEIETIAQMHLDSGGRLLGVTATPVDVGNIYDTLIRACTNSEGRKCGALLPCQVFAPSEAESALIRREVTGTEQAKNGKVKKILTQYLMGHIFDGWDHYNPDHRPTICFAPDVAGSLWIAKQFDAKYGPGTAVHIDGEKCWYEGSFYGRQETQNFLKKVGRGEISVACNRFVLREGINIPELYCGILACTFGSIQTYVQSVGRILRNHPSLDDHVILIDHGGNWWRYGSPNQDWQWELNWKAWEYKERRIERIRNDKEPEPIVCPKCSGVRKSGPICPHCNHTHKGQGRRVIQMGGKLKEQTGRIFKKRRTAPITTKIEREWERMYQRAKRAGMTWRQAEALFAKENYWSWPSRFMKLMPKEDSDWWLKVKDVPVTRLR